MVKKISILVLALLLALVVIEKVVLRKKNTPYEFWRFNGVYKLDDDLIYSHKINSKRSWRFKDNDRTITEVVSINNLGLRDREFNKNEEFDKRILILGDSMTFGHGVNNDETFPNQLESIFSENSVNVDVLNAGVKGYGTDHLYKFFISRLAKLTPDIVVLVIYNNDVSDNIILPLYTVKNGELEELDATKSWLYIIGRLKSITPSLIHDTNIFKFLISFLSYKDMFSQLPDYDRQQLRSWSKQKIYLQIEYLKNLGDEFGFELIVMAMPIKKGSPHQYDWLKDIKEKGVKYKDFNKNDIWTEKKNDLFFKNDYHLTVRGNRVLAEMLYDHLTNPKHLSVY